MTTAHLAPPPTRRVIPGPQPLRVLHLEDNVTDSAAVRRYLERPGFGSHVVCVDNRGTS